MPPSAAPTPNEMLRVMPSSALACCSRPCGATCGTSPVAAGMKNAAAVACSAYSATRCQMRASPLSSSAAVADLDDGARDVGGEQDRAPRQAVGPDAADEHEQPSAGGSPRAARCRAAVGEPPRSSTANASAIGKMPSPRIETVWPQKKSENSRSPSTLRLATAHRASLGASRFWPVISGGGATPSRPSTVGARSPSLPPSRSCAPASVTTSGTGFVVCAVCGEPSGSSICSALPWSAVTSATPPARSTAATITPSAASAASTPAITAGSTPEWPTMSGFARLTTANA